MKMDSDPNPKKTQYSVTINKDSDRI